MNAFHESEQFSVSPLMCLRPGWDKVKGSKMRGVQELVTISAYFQGDDNKALNTGICNRSIRYKSMSNIIYKKTNPSHATVVECETGNIVKYIP